VPFKRAELDVLLDLALASAGELAELQRAVLAEER
jgi:ribonuclease PH